MRGKEEASERKINNKREIDGERARARAREGERER